MPEGIFLMRHVMLVLTDPVPGKEDEYHRWYEETHIPELLETPGFVGAQRFESADPGNGSAPHTYLAIYEVEGDLDEARKALAAAAANRTPPPGALGPDPAIWWFSAVSDRLTP